MATERPAYLLDPLSHELAEPRALEARSPCRVLLVDDDELLRTTLSMFLKDSQYEIEEAANGEEALRVMTAIPCHIVLTDWQMPDMDGLSLCRSLRLSQDEGYVYVVMLSVRGTQDDVLAGLAAGADDYVVKGASLSEIAARLEVGRRITQVERTLRAQYRGCQLSHIDSLTGAHNLRYLLRQLPRELARSERYRHGLSVLSASIEDFRQIRDRYGHESGAQVLRAFVARTERCIRSSDWIARVGDAEFMIVLPETPLAGGHRAARKLKQEFTAESIDTPTGPVSPKLTVSITAVDAHHTRRDAARLEYLWKAAARRGRALDLGAEPHTSSQDRTAPTPIQPCKSKGGHRLN